MNLIDTIIPGKCYGYRHKLMMPDRFTSELVTSYFRVNDIQNKTDDDILISANIITTYEFLYRNYIEREKNAYIRFFNDDADEMEFWEVSNDAFKEIVKNIYNSYEL